MLVLRGIGVSAPFCQRRILASVIHQKQGQVHSSSAAAVNQGVPLSDGPSTSAPPTSGADRNISPRVRELVEEIASLSLLDVSDLNWALKKRLNIPDTPMMPAGMASMMVQATAGAGAAASPAEQQSVEDATPQKTSYSVKLQKFDDTKKIALIKEVRNYLPGMNLVQAKKFIESAPVEVKGDMGKTDAEELKAKLEAVGATCEVL